MRYAWVCHPVTVLSTIVLLLNDHVLKVAWPGPVTGKLSDVAGLIVAPPLVALVFLRRADTAATLLTGALFAAVKSTETGAEVASQAWTLLAGPSRVLADPTDLLALPALALAWWVRSRTAHQHVRRAWIVLAIPLAVLAVTATSQATPPQSATSVRIQEDKIVVVIDAGVPAPGLASRDGGRTWWYWELDSHPAPRGSDCVPGQPHRCYRIEPGRLMVSESDDGGRTWRTSWEVSPGRQEVLDRTYAYAYHEPRSAALAVQARQGGGHVVVVANGLDGIAVRDESGRWRRLGFGTARLADEESLSFTEQAANPLVQAGEHIDTEIHLALTAGMASLLAALAIAIIAHERRRPKGFGIFILLDVSAVLLMLILADLSWLGPLAFLTVLTTPLSVALAGVAALAELVVAYRVGAGWRAIAYAFATAVAVALAVALPFRGWSTGRPDDYRVAVVLAVLTAVAFSATGLLAVWRAARSRGNPPAAAGPM
jgi:hypothetical protein